MKFWLLAFPTVLFFAGLGYAIISEEGVTVVLDSWRDMLGIALGTAVGVIAVWYAQQPSKQPDRTKVGERR